MIISSEEKGKLSGHSQGMTSVTSILYGLLLNFVIRNPHDCFSVVIMWAHTHTHAHTHRVFDYRFSYLSLYTNFLHIGSIMELMWLLINNQNEIAQEEEAEEEALCWRPSWSALLEFLILCLWDIFLFKIFFNSVKTVIVTLLQWTTHTQKWQWIHIPTFFLSLVFASKCCSALYSWFIVFPGCSIPCLYSFLIIAARRKYLFLIERWEYDY